MVADLRTSGVVDAAVSAPSAGDVLRFAAYVAELIGDERITAITWHGGTDRRLHVTVTETMHAETVAHLLGLKSRADITRKDGSGFSCWAGPSGDVPVFLSAPLALGGRPEHRPYEPPSTAGGSR